MGVICIYLFFLVSPLIVKWKKLSNNDKNKLFKCLLCNKHGVRHFALAVRTIRGVKEKGLLDLCGGQTCCSRELGYCTEQMKCVGGRNLQEGKYQDYKEIAKQLALSDNPWATLEESDFRDENLEVCPNNSQQDKPDISTI